MCFIVTGIHYSVLTESFLTRICGDPSQFTVKKGLHRHPWTRREDRNVVIEYINTLNNSFPPRRKPFSLNPRTEEGGERGETSNSCIYTQLPDPTETNSSLTSSIDTMEVFLSQTWVFVGWGRFIQNLLYSCHIRLSFFIGELTHFTSTTPDCQDLT